MGLDWCVRDRVLEGQEANSMFAEAHCNRINEEISKAYRVYLETNNLETPASFPNDVTKAFHSSSGYASLEAELNRWEETRLLCVATPMQTLEAPQIGVDPEADEWASNYYSELSAEIKSNPNPVERLARFLEMYPTVDSYIEQNAGKYVAELAKNKGGLGKVVGMCVGPESFRGKMLRYMEWLDEDLRNEAYENHDPDELVGYGERLLAAAESQEPKAETEEHREEVQTLRDAATWCTFWGENGHSMAAWY